MGSWRLDCLEPGLVERDGRWIAWRGMDDRLIGGGARLTGGGWLAWREMESGLPGGGWSLDCREGGWIAWKGMEDGLPGGGMDCLEGG